MVLTFGSLQREKVFSRGNAGQTGRQTLPLWQTVHGHRENRIARSWDRVPARRHHVTARGRRRPVSQPIDTKPLCLYSTKYFLALAPELLAAEGLMTASLITAMLIPGRCAMLGNPERK